MAKTTKKADGQATTEGVEPMVLALAEQLGTFLGRVQAKADGWLENEELRRQVGQIRDGATQLLDRVNRTAADARKSAKPAKKSKEAAANGPKNRSGGAVDAAGKRHRRPPPQELFDPRLGEPMGKQMGQKNLRRRGRG